MLETTIFFEIYFKVLYSVFFIVLSLIFLLIILSLSKEKKYVFFYVCHMYLVFMFASGYFIVILILIGIDIESMIYYDRDEREKYMEYRIKERREDIIMDYLENHFVFCTDNKKIPTTLPDHLKVNGLVWHKSASLPDLLDKK